MRWRIRSARRRGIVAERLRFRFRWRGRAASLRRPFSLDLMRHLFLPVAVSLIAAAGSVRAQPKVPDAAPRVFVPPVLEWNARTQTVRPAEPQTPRDLARVNGDIVFGMTPQQVAAQLPGVPQTLSWSTLRSAREYSSDVRYFWVRLDDLPEWRSRLSGCVGNTSYVAILFSSRGLFRLSFRLIPDAACPALTEAAMDLLARYMPV